jgi:hypothetical protein
MRRFGYCGRRRAVTRLAMVCAGLLVIASGSRAQCTGDCDGSGSISVGELVVGVNIALGGRPLDDCPSFDRNGNGRVDIGELLAAVAAALGACPTPAATATPVATETPTATATSSPTATPNLPPVVDPVPIYRSFPGYEIRLPLPVRDPEERELQCEVFDLPDGAGFDDETRELHWTPGEDQLGPFYVPFSCEDDAAPPQTAAGELIFRLTALDDCAIPTCAPATGCTVEMRPVDENCCAGEPTLRILEPDAPCPQGRVVFTGRNRDGSFGRLQNCDYLWMSVQQQSGATVFLNVETRCLNTATPIGIYARLANASRGLIFDRTLPPTFFQRRADGFDEKLFSRFQLTLTGPFFDLEDAEANLDVTLTDSNGVSVSESVRVRLTSTRLPELPEADSTPTATPTVRLPTPTPHDAG